MRQNGATGTIRTYDLLIRSQVLYPTKLRLQTYDGGDGEIRTRGTHNARRLSKALVSATHPRLQLADQK